MSFRDMAARDICKTFLNCDEFAEKCTVKYDGVVYKDITASLQDISESDRQHRKDTDYAQGLFRASVVFYCAAEDIGGGHLCKGRSLEITRRADGKQHRHKYTIVSCTCELGMAEAELEEVVARRRAQYRAGRERFTAAGPDPARGGRGRGQPGEFF